MKHTKCELFLPKIEFLSYLVSVERVLVVLNKVDAILKWPTPIYVRDVLSFLGLYNYYRRYIKSFAKITIPLTDLTHKAKEFC